MRTLREMLAYRRPAGSRTEDIFRATFLEPLGAAPDGAGNLILEIPRPDGAPSRVLWSSHTDTVHRQEGLQRVVRHGDVLSLAKGERSNCLGADCTAGIWLMREMARAKVPGLYIWHDSEEIGGVGSRWRAKQHELFDGIDFAIAFDRRGADSIITYQAMGRCCSDAFAEDLAVMLGLDLWADPDGIFTDTANYARIVPECTNVSVGYENEHSPRETLDTAVLFRLRDALISRFAEDDLTVYRDPTAPDYDEDDRDNPWLPGWSNVLDWYEFAKTDESS